MSTAPERANVAIGVFDGVHLGHRDLLERMVQDSVAKGISSVCLTLDPNPESVFHPENPPGALSTIEDRVRRLERLNLTRTEVLPFNGELAQQTAEEFLRWLTRTYAVEGLWGGADFALGRERTGTIAALREVGASLGFEVVAVELLGDLGGPNSSTKIRELLRSGDVRRAARLLGRPYALRGPVAHGAERGRQIGFPTANVVPPTGLVLPMDGVYFVKAEVGDDTYFGAANLGPRPTFGENERLLETHLFDFSGDLYGLDMEVSFLEQLRPTRRFDSADALRAQIEQDISTGRALMAAII